MAIEFSPLAATKFPTGGHLFSPLVATNLPTTESLSLFSGATVTVVNALTYAWRRRHGCSCRAWGRRCRGWLGSTDELGRLGL